MKAECLGGLSLFSEKTYLFLVADLCCVEGAVKAKSVLDIAFFIVFKRIRPYCIFNPDILRKCWWSNRLNYILRYLIPLLIK